jgi:hypothetical protein
MSKITTAVTAARTRWQAAHDARIENPVGSWTIHYSADVRPAWRLNSVTETYEPGDPFTQVIYNGFGATYRSNKIRPPVRQLRDGPTYYDNLQFTRDPQVYTRDSRYVPEARLYAMFDSGPVDVAISIRAEGPYRVGSVATIMPHLETLREGSMCLKCSLLPLTILTSRSKWLQR